MQLTSCNLFAKLISIGYFLGIVVSLLMMIYVISLLIRNDINNQDDTESNTENK